MLQPAQVCGEEGAQIRHAVFELRQPINAEAEGVKPDDVIRRLIETIPVDESEATGRGRQPEVFRSADAG